MKIKVGRSYNRKINDNVYGGKRYESSDCGAWIEMEKEVEKGDVAKEIVKLSKSLDKVARQEVLKSIKARIEEMNGDAPFESEFKEEDGIIMSNK